MQFLLTVLLYTVFHKTSSAPFKTDDDLNDFAHVFSKSANFSADPCEDFYEFVCGAWSNPAEEYSEDEQSFILQAQIRSANSAAKLLTGDIEQIGDTEVDAKSNMGKLKSMMRKFYRECNEEKENGMKPLSFADLYELLKSYDLAQYFDSSRNVSWDDLSMLLGKARFEITLGRPLLNIYVMYSGFQINTGFENFKKRHDLDYRTAEMMLNLFEKDGLKIPKEEKQRIFDEMSQVIHNISSIERSNDKKELKFVNVTELPYINWSIFMQGYTASDISPDENTILQNLETFVDLPYLKKVFEMLSNLSCREELEKLLPGVFSATFAYAHPDNATKRLGAEILHGVHSAYFQLLEENKWMSNQTKEVISERLNSLNQYVGYVPHSNIDNFLTDINYLKSDNRVVILAKLRDREDRAKLRSQLTKERPFDGSDPSFLVNAYYSEEKHRILVLSAFMQAPMLSSVYPASVNYGAFGAVVGHEMAHSFGAYGSEYFSEKRLLKTLEPEAVQQFAERIQCLVDRFDNETDYASNRQLDGKLTENENLADHTGLRAAIRAFESYEQKNGRVKPMKLKGREYSGAQQFFMSFALIECKKPEEHSEWDSHSPSRHRVNVVLQNKPEFAKAFNCPPKSTMNPEQRCRIW